MELTLNSIKAEAAGWEAAGVELPVYDIEAVRRQTAETPQWIHFGAGNIFRGFIAGLVDSLIAEGEMKTGIVAADTFDGEIIDRIYYPHDLLTLSVGLCPDGKSVKKVTAGIADAVRVDTSDAKAEGMEKLKACARNQSLQMISFTITEKGYACTDIEGRTFEFVEKDIEAGPEGAATAMGIVAALLFERYNSGEAPITLVSMDNCSRNGQKLRNAVLFMAEGWRKKGYVDDAFISYISDETRVAFPWSMIDKITPRPDDSIASELAGLGIEGMEPIITSRNTYIAPFVNAEIPQYLVIEDAFPNGRPPLEKAGVYMTDRDTVNKAEGMKVMTCLNPLHTALAVTGCLLGYDKISSEMGDADLKELVYKLGDEGMKVVVSPGIISPEEFIREVLEERLPNPYLPDTPQRIATDTSQKMAIRYGETIKGYVKMGKTDEMKYIPFVIAAWIRYLMAVDDKGMSMNLSSDPMLDTLLPRVAGLRLGEGIKDTSDVDWILERSELFGSNLLELAPLAEKIKTCLNDMLRGEGAVRETLHKIITEE